MAFRAVIGPVAAAALLGAAIASAPSASAAEPFELPVIIPLTGPAAFLGQGELTTLQIVEKTVNASGGIEGRPLHFAIKDDQSNPQVSVQIAGEILAGKSPVMLGSSLVASCRAISPLMENAVVNYCFSPGIHPEKGSYTFTSSVSTTDLISAQLRYFRLKGWVRVALIVSTDATGQDAENSVREALALPENKDMTLVTAAHFNTSDVSVSAQIETVKAANPQAFIAWSTGTPIGTIFRAVAASGLRVPTVTTSGNMTYSQMEQYKAFLPDELYFPVAEWVVRDAKQLRPGMAERHAAFYGSYAEVGKKPDISSELAWDPAMIIVAALRKLGTTASATQIHETIAHLKGYAGVDGVFDFEKVPQRGLSVADAVVTRWDKKSETWNVVSGPTGIPLQD
jgi:branched-chain amino acid transport system substrate-binding protein